MCGITGFHLKREGLVKNHESMELFANLLLSGIEMRGKQATGFAALTFDGKRVVLDKRPVNAEQFIDGRKPMPKDTRTFLGHTRFKTKGSNDFNGNLHPVSYGSCLAIHNGSIFNDDDLFAEHKLERYAQVDTEIIPALIQKHGWKKAAKALSELRGSFAIAAVDTQFPGEVLLAKGNFNPLMYHENDNFVVWSSSKFAIREAWKEVLGTPPEWNKIQELDECEILWLDGKDTRKERFTKAALPFRGTAQKVGNSGTNVRSIFERNPRIGHQRGSGGGGRNYTNRGTVPDRRADVATLRADGNSKVILHGQYTHEELLERVKDSLVFHSCGGCGGLVHKSFFITRPNEGKVCLDCDYIAKWGVKGPQNLVIDVGTRNQLDAWAAKEAVAHRDALKEVEKQTLLDVDAVDYLVFRAPPTYLDKHPAMADLAEKLDDLYQEAYSAAFDALLDQENESKKDRGSEDEKPWHTHPLSHPHVNVVCGTCRKFKAPGKECTFCEKRKQREAEDKLIDLSKCWCGEPAAWTVGGAAAFCEYHFTLCNFEPSCEAGRRKSDGKPGFTAYANHTLADGKRMCHYHARSKKGAYSDTVLKQKGVRFRQLVGSKEPGGL